MSRWYLITAFCRNGFYETYSETLVKTEREDVKTSEWEKEFLDWEFGGIEYNSVDEHYWSDARIVRVYSVLEVPEEDIEVLKKYKYVFSFDEIVKERDAPLNPLPQQLIGAERE